MDDLAYLRTRHAESLDNAERAASEPARRAHAQFASLYEARIAAAQRDDREEQPPAGN